MEKKDAEPSSLAADYGGTEEATRKQSWDVRGTQRLTGTRPARGQKEPAVGSPRILNGELGWGRIEKRHAQEFEFDFLLLDKRGW